MRTVWRTALDRQRPNRRRGAHELVVEPAALVSTARVAPEINLTIEDSSVYQNVEGAVAPTVAGRPVIRQFRSTNTMVLRDGQTSADRSHAQGGEVGPQATGYRPKCDGCVYTHG